MSIERLHARGDGEHRLVLEPIFNVLETSVTVVLANPLQVKNLAAHKTDRRDGRRLAHLLRHGQIEASFIPPRPIRELRDLTRRRRQLLGIGASERNSIGCGYFGTTVH